MIEPRQPRDIVFSLLMGAVPERKDDLKSLWETHSPSFELTPDSDHLRMGEKAACVRFSSKTVDVYWLIGFAGWRSIECYQSLILCSQITRRSLLSIMSADLELKNYEQAYHDRLRSAQQLIKVKDRSAMYWPEDIPLPTNERDSFDNDQHKVAFDLVALATAFIFLHEVRHCLYSKAGSRPSVLADEEMDCDVWAREYLTTGIGAYAKTSRQSFEKILQKRSMGMALATLIIYEITTEEARGDTLDYYAVSTRMRAIIDNTKLPEDNGFWGFMGAILIGILRSRSQPFDPPVGTGKVVALSLLKSLENCFKF